MKKECQQLKKGIYCSSAFKKLSGSAEFTAQQSVKLKLPGRNALEICDVDSIFQHVKLKELISEKYILGKSITITSGEQTFSIMNNQLHVNNSSSWHQIKCCLRLTSMSATTFHKHPKAKRALYRPYRNKKTSNEFRKQLI